MTGAQAPQT